MEARLFEPEEDVGKAQFQQELNRWFQSRGIFTELRSHLRHLLIKALQNSQVGAKGNDRNSPKSGAMCLMIAEYLFRLGCHYTLSVFTSEVSSLVNFNPEGVLRGGKKGKKGLSKHCFQQAEVDDIFNALGMPARDEEFDHAKSKYFQEGSETCLIELLIQMVLQMATRVKVGRDVESRWEEGERLLSKEWSSRLLKILANEKLTPDQVSAMEEAIFRMTESELKRLIDEERELRMQMLTNREKRIQDYLKRHEEEMFSRLKAAEHELATRKATIDEELAQRERHLAEMAFEWNSKHDEILQISKNFHNIENENQNLQKKLKELEEDNKNLKSQEDAQTKTIDGLLGEMNLLINKLREATDSNSALSERIQVLINQENKEAPALQDSANQEIARVFQEDLPLLWFKNLNSEMDLNLSNQNNKESSPKRKFKFTIRNSEVWHRDRATNVNIGSGDAHGSGTSDESEGEDAEEDVSMSSSFDEIIVGVRKKLQNLEEHSNRLNQNYLEFKLKCVSVNSDSESSRPPSAKASPTPIEDAIARETKFCQTETANGTNAQDTYAKILKLTETKEKRSEPEACPSKKPDLAPLLSPSTLAVPLSRPPTKRQLQNREFFAKSRQLLQTLEKQKIVGLHTSPSSMESEDERAGCSQKKSPVRAVPIKVSINSKKSPKNQPAEKAEVPPQMQRPEVDCLSLLEDVRIRSPQLSARMPLRQQILLSESEDERDNSRTGLGSPPTISSGIISVGKRSEGSG